MTRINCVDPSLLSQLHLIAEYRELPRIFGNIKNAIDRGESPTDKRNPTNYVLGKGHVRFFYNKALWLLNRQKALISECLSRGYDIKYTSLDELIIGIPYEWCNDWDPSITDIELNISRINERGGLRVIT
jgi:hypothetical protein